MPKYLKEKSVQKQWKWTWMQKMPHLFEMLKASLDISSYCLLKVLACKAALRVLHTDMSCLLALATGRNLMLLSSRIG